MIRTSVPFAEYHELEKEVRELETELFSTFQDLVIANLKFNKLAALCPHVNTDKIKVDESEVVEELKKIGLAV